MPRSLKRGNSYFSRWISDVASTLAVLYEKQGNYEQATPLFQRALAALEQRLGQAHPETARVLSQYTSLLRRAEK
jgi:tetratricopeptide (TPR) repeat protein